jgi:addiction module HigA family antidote
VIKSFKDRDTERPFRRESVRKFGAGVQRVALRKLRMLDAATILEDLRVSPGNRLEKLKGDREGLMPSKKLAPVHPGEILLEEFLEPMGISQYRLAKDISVSPRRINEIVHGQRAITADTALRLSRYFGTSERFWLNLQAGFDLEIEKDRLGKRLEAEVLQRAG